MTSPNESNVENIVERVNRTYHDRRSDYWMRIAAAAFGLWAIMIPIGVGLLREALSEQSKATSSLRDSLVQLTVSTERRMTTLEAQGSVAATHAADAQRAMQAAQEAARIAQSAALLGSARQGRP